MTGYASATSGAQTATDSTVAADASAARSPAASLTSVMVELRSVNNRFLDLSLRLPDEFRSLEPVLRDLITKRFRRGKVELRLNTHRETESAWPTPQPDQLNRLLHRTIRAVAEGYESLRFNTSIARISELNNAVTQAYPDGGAPRALAEPMVLMLAPLAPHIAEELWHRLGHQGSLAWSPFPAVDERFLVEDTIEIPVQVNGKVRSVITVPTAADRAEVAAAARSDDKVLAALAGRAVQRVVVVPGRLVNLVV